MADDPEKGADTLVFLAEGQPGVDFSPGEHFAKRKVAKPNKQANDAALARELWARSEKMTMAFADMPRRDFPHDPLCLPRFKIEEAAIRYRRNSQQTSHEVADGLVEVQSGFMGLYKALGDDAPKDEPGGWANSSC